MAEKLDEKELVSFKEMMMANSIQVDAVCQLLIEKGVITEKEFYRKLKEVQQEYESKKAELKKSERKIEGHRIKNGREKIARGSI
jgi:hypothetical protein